MSEDQENKYLHTCVKVHVH